MEFAPEVLLFQVHVDVVHTGGVDVLEWTDQSRMIKRVKLAASFQPMIGYDKNFTYCGTFFTDKK